MNVISFNKDELTKGFAAGNADVCLRRSPVAAEKCLFCRSLVKIFSLLFCVTDCTSYL